MINKVVLIGRMTKDPELRRTSGGTAVASFSLAVNRNVKDKDGNTPADFIPVTVWNKAAENVSQYCHKGSLVAVEGRIQQSTWQDNNGQNKSRLDVVAESVQFLETKQATSDKTSDKYGYAAGYEPQTSNAVGFGFDIMDDDIQF